MLLKRFSRQQLFLLASAKNEMLISYVLTRTKQGLDLSDELARAKRLLDEKYFEAGRLREESVAKGDSNNGARA